MRKTTPLPDYKVQRQQHAPGTRPRANPFKETTPPMTSTTTSHPRIARGIANARRFYEAAGIAERIGIGNPETLRATAAVYAVATSRLTPSTGNAA